VRDLEAEREAVKKALDMNRDEFQTVAMEFWVSTDERPKEVCLDQLQQSDIYIGIVGFFYCSKLDPESGKSLTQVEYEFAKEHNIPRFVFLKDEDANVKPSFVEQDPKKVPLIKAFREQVRVEGIASTFKTSEELAKLVVITLHKYISHGYDGRPRIPGFEELGRRASVASSLSFNELLATRKDDTGTIVPGRYSRELYVQREKIQKEFDNFLKELEKTGFFVVADSGLGKTNLLCHLYEKCRSEGNVVLFYSSTNTRYKNDPNIRRIVLEDLGVHYSVNSWRLFYQMISEIGRRCAQAGKKFIIIFDAINEHTDPQQLLIEINELIGRCEASDIKVAASCRRESWRWLTRLTTERSVSLYETKLYKNGESESWTLLDFDKDLLERAYENYKNAYRLRTDYTELSPTTIEFLLHKKSNPLMLRFISETYMGRLIPRHAPDQDVFQLFYKERIEKDPEAATFLGRLVDAMIVCRSAKPTQKQFVSADRDLSKAFENPSKKSPFTRLKDLTVLYERGHFAEDKEVGFEYEAFFEFVLATRLFPLEKEIPVQTYVNRIREGREFGSLWGAVKTALVLKHDLKLIKQLLDFDDVDVRGIVIETITELGSTERTRESTLKFAKKVLKENVPSFKRLVTMALSEMQPCPIDLLSQVILDKDKTLSFVAMQYGYLLWKRNHRDGRSLVESLYRKGLDLKIARVPSPRALIASFELQAMIFFNHYDDDDAISLVNDLALERVRKIVDAWERRKLLLVATEVSMNLFTRTFGTDFDFWFRRFYRKASEEERAHMRSLAKYIDPSLLLEEIEDILMKSTQEPKLVEGVAKLVLAAHARTHPKTVLSILQRLMISNYAHSRLLALESLAHSTMVNEYFLEKLESSGNVIWNLSGKGEELSRVLGTVGLAICRVKRGKISVIHEITENAVKCENHEVLGAVLMCLGTVGVNYPDDALLTMRDVLEYVGPCRPALIESLARIRLLHADIVDTYLEHFPTLRDEVRHVEVTSPYSEWFGGKGFGFDVVIAFPEFRSILIEFIHELSRVHNDKDFQKFVRYCVDRSTRTWLDRKNFEKYLQWVRERSGSYAERRETELGSGSGHPPRILCTCGA